MNDNDIIKALECCRGGKREYGCNKCPLYCRVPACTGHLTEAALDLINRQKAENKTLTEYNDNLLSANAALSCNLLDEIKKARTEAIKEIAFRFDRLVTEIYNKHIFGSDLWDTEKEAVMDYSGDITCAFDNLVEEMTEDEDETK